MAQSHPARGNALNEPTKRLDAPVQAAVRDLLLAEAAYTRAYLDWMQAPDREQATRQRRVDAAERRIEAAEREVMRLQRERPPSND